VTVSEAGVPAINSGSAFRIYAERGSNGLVETGVAVMNIGNTETRVTIELATLDGHATGLTGTVVLPARAQQAFFLNTIPGFESLPAGFRGVARISSENQTSIAVMGLRCRWNERGDFLTTTTPPVNEAAGPNSRILFPHIANGSGFTTEFITFTGTSSQPASGSLQTFNQSGSSLNLGLR
jgi:hypothetical protein